MAKKLSSNKKNIQFLVPEGHEILAPGHEKHSITFDPNDPRSARSQINGDYVVLFGKGSPKKPLSSNEYLRLDLQDQEGVPCYYELHFQGKQTSALGGLVVPAEFLHYYLSICDDQLPYDLNHLQWALKKKGFEKKTLVMHQENPFEEGQAPHLPVIQRFRLNLAWITTLPVREFRDKTLRSLSIHRESPLFRLAFALMALTIFILLPILSLDAGLSGDDEKHYQHAAKVYRYFAEDDPAALDDPNYKLNYYGQSFDFFSYMIIKWFGLEDHPYEARHFMVALTGAAAVLCTGLLVKLFAGYAGGLLALVLMFLSPRFLGHSFNNPMDVPFLLGNVFTLYHMILFLKKLPRISTSSAIFIALGIGWANGIRIGGLLLVPYLFMFAGLYLLLKRWPWKIFSKDWWVFAMKGLLTLVLISLAGYLLSLLTWPYALQDIVNHPANAFKVMSNIQVSIRVLYDGVVHWSDQLPWHYIPKNIWLTVPTLVLLACLASPIMAMLDRNRKQGYWYFMLWFTILFPLLFIIYRESNVYGGWRHMMFVYPSILALAAMSLSSLMRRAGAPWQRYLLLAVIAAGIFHPLKHTIRNHPNTYIYFNELSGGIKRTFGTMETDFYANSLYPASKVFLDEILPEAHLTDGEQVRVVSNFPIPYYFRNHRDQVTPFYSRYYDLGMYDWDYAILYCNYIHPYHLNNGFWPPKNTIHEVKVDQVVVAAIVERKNKMDHYGSDMLIRGMNEQNVDYLEDARRYLEAAIEYDPHNIKAHLDLGNVYTGFLEFDRARALMDQLLEIYPDYDKALNLKGYSYLVEAEFKGDLSYVDRAIQWLNQSIRSNYKFYTGYYNLALCYGLKNDLGNTEYNLKQAIKYNARFVEAYNKLAELYESQGNRDAAMRVRQQASRWK